MDEDDDWPGSRNGAAGSGSLGDISETLSGYCMAEGTLDPADVPQMEARIGRALAAGLGEPEQAVLTPVSFEEEYGHWAEGSFFAQTGVADFSGSCGTGSAGGSGTPTVRLAILDTSPTLGPLEAGRVDDGIDPATFLAALPSTHGLSLAATARHLLCSDPADPATCPLTVATRQALPYIWATGQTLAWASTNGQSLGHGQVGTQLWLARALRRELLSWERNGGGAPGDQPELGLVAGSHLPGRADRDRPGDPAGPTAGPGQRRCAGRLALGPMRGRPRGGRRWKPDRGRR